MCAEPKHLPDALKVVLLLFALVYCVVHYKIIEKRHRFPLESEVMLMFLLLHLITESYIYILNI